VSAVLGLAVRQVRRGTAVVATLAAGASVLVIVSYHGLFAGSDDRTALAAVAANPAIRTLFGPAPDLADPGGFAAWRTGTPLAVLVAAWALVTAVRVTRGEEATGRWNLLLAGRTTLAAVVARHTAVLAAGAAVIGAATAVALAAMGPGAGGAALFGCGIALVGAFFAGVGATCAQVFASRAAATGAGASVLGVALLTRMLGDGVPHLAGLRWASPFGLIAATRPFAGDHLLPLAVLAAMAAAASGAATALARRRDVGDGILAVPTVRASRPWLLGSVGGFAVRGALGVTAGWAVAVGAALLLMGAIADSLTGFLTANPRLTDLAARGGVTGLDRTEGYAGAMFGLLAVAVSLYTVVRTAGLAAEETAGRLTLLLANPVARTRILATHACATLGGALVLLTVAAVAMWAGTGFGAGGSGSGDALAGPGPGSGLDLGSGSGDALAGPGPGSGLDLGAALAGAWNVLPLVVLSLAAAVLALGAAPRVVAPVGAVPAVGGFLLKAAGTAMSAPPWLIGISPFTHLAPVPLTSPNWAAADVMLAIAAVLSVAGARAYTARDLHT
jgi:ABC-2 type transport system permease protein